MIFVIRSLGVSEVVQDGGGRTSSTSYYGDALAGTESLGDSCLEDLSQDSVHIIRLLLLRMEGVDAIEATLREEGLGQDVEQQGQGSYEHTTDVLFHGQRLQLEHLASKLHHDNLHHEQREHDDHKDRVIA